MPILKPSEAIEPKGSYSLKNADRELSVEEAEAEEKAEKFSLKGFGRIKPIQGTIGYAIRNLCGGNTERNESVIEFLKWAAQDSEGQTGNRSKFVQSFVILWNNMDEFSRRRVDIFDILCRKYNVPVRRFWGILQEGIFDFNDKISQTAISELKPEFVELLNKQMKKDRNHQDRRLMAEAMNFTGTEPLIKIEDNSQNTVNNNLNQFSSFTSSIKNAEKGIRHKDIAMPELEHKQLTEGETEFIEGELIEEKDLVLRHEQQLETLAKGI